MARRRSAEAIERQRLIDESVQRDRTKREENFPLAWDEKDHSLDDGQLQRALDQPDVLKRGDLLTKGERVFVVRKSRGDVVWLWVVVPDGQQVALWHAFTASGLLIKGYKLLTP